MTTYQLNLEGGETVAGLTPIQRQLAAIMDDRPETLGDEDLLAALWLCAHNTTGSNLMLRYAPKDVFQVDGLNPAISIVCYLIRAYRKANIRERRRELTKMGYPWPEEEAARRQRQGRAGAPGGRCVK